MTIASFLKPRVVSFLQNLDITSSRFFSTLSDIFGNVRYELFKRYTLLDQTGVTVKFLALTSEQLLYANTIPGQNFVNQNDIIRCKFNGVVGVTSTTKTLKFKLGTQTILSQVLVSGQFEFDAKFAQISAGGVQAVWTEVKLLNAHPVMNYTTVNFAFTADQLISFTGTTTSANASDVVLGFVEISFQGAPSNAS